ncbi:MAG TPA: winged helix DNA-binding domain-containing protein, partial [Rhodothermales bacterium]
RPTMPETARRRLRSQLLTGGAVGSAEEVVDWLVAVQSQDFIGAKWAVGLRMRAATDAVVERAFNDGAILRTHLLRPTWHFVLPRDIRWLLMLTGPRVQAQNMSMCRKLGLDQQTLSRAAAAMGAAVSGGRFATRDELREVVEAAGISTEGLQRMTYIVMYAELEGMLCSGPRRGKQFTYALLDERADPLTIDRDEALQQLTRRYFESRGPATVHDYARWSGLTLADARRGIDACGSALRREEIDGTTHWLGPAADGDDSNAPTAFLLSVYDEYLSGYRDRSAMVSHDHGQRLINRGNALNYVLVVDTQIVGTWKRTFSKTAVSIEIEVFQKLTSAQRRAVDAAAQRIGKFMELRPETVVTVDGRP